MSLLKVIGAVVAIPFAVVNGTVGIICNLSSPSPSNCDATQAVEVVAEASQKSNETRRRVRENE